MAKSQLIRVESFGMEIGTIGFDENRRASFFQYHPEFIREENYLNLFPLIFKKTKTVQVFNKFNTEAFRGLPPMIADSLPDVFGNLIFKTWLENNNRNFEQISILEQLAYVGRRGMGALEYLPSKEIPSNVSIDIGRMTEIVQLVIENKIGTRGDSLDHISLLNIFKIGTSAGGARPKILVSEHKITGEIIAGDLEYSDTYFHYLVKLGIDEDMGFSRETLEYVYYLTASSLGISMMDSKLIDQKHFATLRYDRLNGKKIHVLTACGMTGWDFQDPQNSSYENLFDLCFYLKLPHVDIESLFRRMAFNIIFANNDDHLKNHSFQFNELENKWRLAPAYDLTYSLNPLINVIKAQRALSVNGKRIDINLKDILLLADKYAVRNAKGIIAELEQGISEWRNTASQFAIPEKVIAAIEKSFVRLS